ncbi:MAG TPA: TonB-dependent receptor [Steroidobacteraceae bacterium]
MTVEAVVPIARAQDAAAPGLEEVVVTARRVEESLQSTPVAVTALSAQVLEQRNMTDVRELAMAVPNLVLQTSGANGGSQVPAIFIRGLGQADVVLTADPAVGLYVDGVYIARNSGNILSLLDLERVEVLRGPQGTLFGKNTIGGAINLVSAKPNADFDMAAELTAGSYDRKAAKFSINLPLTDSLFLKLATLGEQRDGYMELSNYPGKALGDSENWAARGALRWLPSGDVTVDLVTDFSSTRDVGPPYRLIETFPNAASAGLYNALLSGNPAACLSPAGQASNPACYGPVQLPANNHTSNIILYDRNLEKIDPDNDFDTFGAALTVSWELPFGTLRSISAYRNLRSGFNFDGDYSATMLIGGYARRQKSDQYSEELQLFGTAAAERLKWLIGGYYFDEDTFGQVEVLSVFALPAGRYPLLTDNYGPTDTKNYAAFGQATYDLTARVHLTAGARWTKEDKSAILYTLPQQPQGLPGDLEVDEWTPMLSVGVDLAEHALAYASFAQGFRSGGFPPRVIGQVSEIPTYGPETSTTYEVGLKAEWLDQRLRTNLALFTNDFEDFQAGGLAPGITPPLPTVINAGNARIKGAELEIAAAPIQAVRIDAALSYLTNELTDVNPTTNDSGVQVTRDNKLPYSPEWKASLGVSWRLPLPTRGDLVARVDGAYTGKMFFSLGNLPEASQDSVTLLDGSFAYTTADRRWEFVIGGKNLTDRDYYTSKATDRVSAGFAAGTYGVVAPPRTYFGTVRWHY